jgi:hypothetical protein
MATVKSKGQAGLKVLEVIKKSKHVSLVAGGNRLAEIGKVPLMMVTGSGTNERLIATMVDGS